LAGPPQRGVRITPAGRLDQGLQRRRQVGVVFDPRLASAAGAAGSVARCRLIVTGQLPKTLVDGTASQPGGTSDQGLAAVTDGFRLGGRPEPAGTLVEGVGEPTVLGSDRRLGAC